MKSCKKPVVETAQVSLRPRDPNMSHFVARWFASLFRSPARDAAEYGAAIAEKTMKQKPCTCGHGEPFHFDRFCSPELLASMPAHVDGACRMTGCGCGAYDAMTKVSA